MDLDSHSDVPNEARQTTELPEDVVTLASSEGQRRLDECSADDGGGESPSQYSSIGPCFRRQVGPKFCGVASTAIVLSSLPGCERVEEAQVFSLYEDGGKGKAGAPRPRTVEAAGVTLDELHKMASSIPQLQPATSFYSEEMGGGVDELRSVICGALSRDGEERVLLNYHMSTLGQTPFGGHVSPVAAFHRPSDSFLIMDTWPQTEPVWAPARRIWEATTHVDKSSNRSRGLVVTGFRRERRPP